VWTRRTFLEGIPKFMIRPRKIRGYGVERPLEKGSYRGQIKKRFNYEGKGPFGARITFQKYNQNLASL